MSKGEEIAIPFFRQASFSFYSPSYAYRSLGRTGMHSKGKRDLNARIPRRRLGPKQLLFDFFLLQCAVEKRFSLNIDMFLSFLGRNLICVNY